MRYSKCLLTVVKNQPGPAARVYLRFHCLECPILFEGGLQWHRIATGFCYLEVMVAAQIDVVQGLTFGVSATVTNLGVHGTFNNILTEDDFVVAIRLPLKDADQNVICFEFWGSQVYKAAKKPGRPLTGEGVNVYKNDDDAKRAANSVAWDQIINPQNAVEGALGIVLRDAVVSMSTEARGGRRQYALRSRRQGNKFQRRPGRKQYAQAHRHPSSDIHRFKSLGKASRRS